MKIVYFEEYAERKAVETAYPDAAVIRLVNGGWAVFDTYEDYENWSRPKPRPSRRGRGSCKGISSRRVARRCSKSNTTR